MANTEIRQSINDYNNNNDNFGEVSLCNYVILCDIDTLCLRRENYCLSLYERIINFTH